jgi:sugar phosphate isomerase/epimerase
MDDRLLATCWSSAGDAASDRADLCSPLDLRDRIEAAAAAGFTGFGLLSADLPAAEEKYGLDGIRAMLDDNGIVDLELEGIPYWYTVHRRRYCGEGVFDLTGMAAALRTAGWTGPWGVEILSVEHRSLPVRDALRRAADSARHVL